MKKSLFVLLFSTLLVVSCSSNDNQVIHRHAYEVSWTYNNDQHWHAATCGHNVKGSLDDHHFGDWTIDVAPTETFFFIIYYGKYGNDTDNYTNEGVITNRKVEASHE